MKVYIIAIASGLYMYPAHEKVYKQLGPAQKKCDQLNKERSPENQVSVLYANNWQKV